MGGVTRTPASPSDLTAAWPADRGGTPETNALPRRREADAIKLEEPAGRGWLCLALLISALLCAPYLLAMRSFFYTDDWVHLLYNGLIPPWQVWRYFSPRVIWFYRPMQALQFGWLYHIVGLHPLAYNLSLMALHLGVCLLLFLLVSQLTTPRTALLATALFASQCLCADVLLWRSNFNTLDWALASLGMCVLFLRYLKRRTPGALVGVYALFLASFLAKETAVVSPCLLLLLWWCQGSQEEGSTGHARCLEEAARLVGPFFLMTLLYIGFHAHLVTDVYDGYVGPYYRFASPGRAIWQTLFSTNFLLLSFHRDPLILPLLPALRAGALYLVGRLPILPFLVGAAAALRRDRALAVGLLWIFVTLGPTACLAAFQMDRFYYLPAVGAAMMIARSAQLCWHWLSRPDCRLRSARLLLPAGVAYLIVANLSAVSLQCLTNHRDSLQLEAAFLSLQTSALQVPRGALVVLKHPPSTYFRDGMGVREMVCLGLNDQTAVGIVQGQQLSPRWARRLDSIRSIYVLDFAHHPLALCPYSPSIARGTASD
jgi:hypothetical protein